MGGGWRERHRETETGRENSVAFGFPKRAAWGFVCALFSFLRSGREARPPLDNPRTQGRGRQASAGTRQCADKSEEAGRERGKKRGEGVSGAGA